MICHHRKQKKPKNKKTKIMNSNLNLVGSCWCLTVLPTWATVLILFMVTIGVIFILRDRCEGLFYNTSYSAMIGDGTLLVVVLIAAEILKRGILPLKSPEWMSLTEFHIFAGIVGAVLGFAWLELDQPKQWGDRYHHLVIAPLLCYLLLTLLPVIFKNGTSVEITATICLIALWAVLFVYDAKTKRLDQRKYHSLGGLLNTIRESAYYEKEWKKHR